VERAWTDVIAAVEGEFVDNRCDHEAWRDGEFRDTPVVLSLQGSDTRVIHEQWHNDTRSQRRRCDLLGRCAQSRWGGRLDCGEARQFCCCSSIDGRHALAFRQCPLKRTQNGA